MSTHQPQYLGDADDVLVLEGGRIARHNDYRSLLASGMDFSTVVYDDTPSPPPPASAKSVLERGSTSGSSAQQRQQRAAAARGISETTTIKGNGAVSYGATSAVIKGIRGKGAGVREADEDRRGSAGQHGMAVYGQYCKACGIWTVAATLAISIVSQVVSVSKEAVLAHWSGSFVQGGDANAYLCAYAAVCLATACMTCLRFLMVCWMGLKGSRALHQALLDAITATHLRFFQVTSGGRIISRFSSDCDTLDLSIPTTLASFADAFLAMCTAFTVVAVATPAFILFVPPMAYAYYRIQQEYRVPSVALKRLDSACKSPLLSHFAQTLDGLVSAQGLCMAPRLQWRVFELADACSAARLCWDATNRWLGIHLDLLGASAVLLSALLTVLLRNFGGGAGVAGLALSYALTITRTLSFGVRAATAMENQFNAVDRIGEFAALPHEENAAELQRWQAAGGHQEANGSTGGSELAVQVEQVQARYSAELPAALKGVSLSIAAGERIGICGRTGCGKSTLALTLIRVVEASEGRILLRGKDIRAMPLQQLRSDITVIPQDAHLFSGTIRQAIDPSGTADDARIWEVIREVGLQEAISALPGGLSGPVQLQGANWSAGQRQLVCVARAMLTGAHTFVFDEATANVDMQSDAVIQELVEQKLQDKTVIIIAHRLEDVLRYSTRYIILKLP
eukprot:TRINITY_DN1513_c0_g1_i4.p1 TRINITY_DN1513_c0_g1~~TRINITY_DN1513_c0_g1_i4.p1  ORF type:complete len:763 (-),score=226.48 TRINITY_DN1513_c0_g1_i4:801-2846(-)